MTAYAEFTNVPRWKYGYAQYEKTLEQLSKPPESNVATSWWPTLAVLKNTAAELGYAAMTFTSYYIFVIDPNGQKRIAGEWTLAQGGREARDNYFNNVFTPAFTGAVNDIERVAAVTAASKAVPTFSMDTFKATLAAKVSGSGPGGGGGGVGDALPLVVLGLGCLVAYLFLRHR